MKHAIYDHLYYCCAVVRFIVINATFNNISVISWRTVLVVEETEIPVEIHRPAAGHLQTIVALI